MNRINHLVAGFRPRSKTGRGLKPATTCLIIMLASCGRSAPKLEAPSAPQRIISAVPNVTEMLFAFGLGLDDVHDAALGGEVRVSAAGERGAAGAARGVLRKGNADFEVGADGDVEMRHEGGSIAAKIFAGSIFFEGEAAGIAAADFKRQSDGDSTFRALPRYRGAGRDHGLGPQFW